jgi:hemoglobin/transferrin/lactoferrin receptor protein
MTIRLEQNRPVHSGRAAARRATALALVMSMAAAGEAAAQTVAGDTETETVVTTTEGDSTVLDRLEVQGGGEASPTPGVESIAVTTEDLERVQPSDLQDVFRSQPSVKVGSSLAISQKIYVQGVEENALSVTIDGARQNNKVFHHNATTYIDPELLKAARVDPGVAPADAGPGALGGSVVFETKDVADLLEPGKAFGGSLTSSYETNGDTFSTSGTAYGAIDGFEVLGYLKFADGDEFESGDGQTIPGSAASVLSGLGKVAYEAESGDRFEFSYEQVNDDGVRPNRADFLIGGGRPNVIYDLTRQNAVFTYTDETPTGMWDPTVLLAYGVTEVSADPSGDSSVGTTDTINGKFENNFALGLGDVVAGIDFYSDEALYEGDSGNFSEQANNIGAYTQARLDLTDRARLSVGGRADLQQFEGTNGYEEDNAGLSGNISGEYDITDILTASAGYSHVWGGIALAENYLLPPGRGGVVLSELDYADGLEPVTSDNLTAGLSADFGNGFTLGGRVFRTDIDDARVLLRETEPFQRHIVTQGYELAAGYEWGAGFVRVGFADIDSEIDGRPADSDIGRYLTTPVGQIFTVSAAHTFEQWGVTVGADAEFGLEYADTYNNDTGTRGEPLPAYEVVNAHIEYQPQQFDHITLRAEVKNLFDENYADRATYGQEYGVSPLLEPGRSFKLSATARF